MPEIEALKKKYGNDQKKLSEEQQNLYMRYNINPMMAACRFFFSFRF